MINRKASEPEWPKECEKGHAHLDSSVTKDGKCLYTDPQSKLPDLADRKASEVEKAPQDEVDRITNNLVDMVRHATFERMSDGDSQRAEDWIMELSRCSAVRAEQQGQLKGCLCNCHDAPNEMFPKQHDDCLTCMKGLIEEAEALGKIAAEQQVAHVANCRCHDTHCGRDMLPKRLQHGHPYRDPRCGESIELVKAKARLDGLYDAATELWNERRSWDRSEKRVEQRLKEARAAVDKLEKEKS